ncbi:MAG: ABC transporter ATP-binding protein [Sphingobacteriales bacterium]|nr:MAG: ABC transporter ATP-binding protein [Sphingobacteriales bacterium]
MQIQFKNNFIGYFRFYYSVVGARLLVNLGLCILVSFFDGIGLAMFMPLLQSVSGTTTAVGGKAAMGKLHYVTEAIEGLGVSLTLNTVLVMLVVLFTFKGVLKLIQQSYQTRLRQTFMKKLRHSLVDGLQGVSYEGFLKLDSGKIQNTLTTEVQKVNQSMNGYFNASQACVMLVTYIALAFLANYQFAILVAIGAGLTNVLYRRIYLSTKRVSKSLSKKGSDFNGLLLQSVHNFKYLKATNYLSNFNKKLKKVINKTEQLNKRIGMYSAITISMKEPMIITVVVAVIYFQINVIGSSFTTILLSLLLFYRALSFLVTVQNHWHVFVQNIGSLESVAELSGYLYKQKEAKADKAFTTLQGKIELRDVQFSYGTHKVLNAINITIPKNQTIALIGESGSGKTTLANMISCLIEPQEGKMLVDNVAISEYDLDTFRSKIGYISQEPVIFNDDIYNNITFWAERTDENIARFWDTIELAALSDFISRQPEQEKTKLGDNGILISGGQKQRISIARELYKQAEILILDEATSALDSETEKVIKENIDALRGKYTIVVIAHRLSTIRNVDNIFLMDKGNVMASGAFDQLIEASGKFKRMVELQEF